MEEIKSKYFSYPYGTLYSTDREIIKQSWENFPDNASFTSAKFAGCFGSYFANKELTRKRDFYFAFPLLPLWYNKLIVSLNKLFKNIKYTVVCEKDMTFSWLRDYYGEKRLVKSDKDIVARFKVPIFSLELSKEYSMDSVYVLRYVLHHIIRMISFTEGFIPYSEDISEDGLDYVVKINNEMPEGNSRYRTLSVRDINSEDLKYLDDPKKVNEICAITRLWNYARQTDLLNSIIYYSKHNILPVIRDRVIDTKFKDGDLVVPNEYTQDRYSITRYPEMKLGVVVTRYYTKYCDLKGYVPLAVLSAILITSDQKEIKTEKDDTIRVKILQHEDRSEIGSIYEVNDFYFDDANKKYNKLNGEDKNEVDEIRAGNYINEPAND